MLPPFLFREKNRVLEQGCRMPAGGNSNCQEDPGLPRAEVFGAQGTLVQECLATADTAVGAGHIATGDAGGDDDGDVLLQGVGKSLGEIGAHVPVAHGFHNNALRTTGDGVVNEVSWRAGVGVENIDARVGERDRSDRVGALRLLRCCLLYTSPSPRDS